MKFIKIIFALLFISITTKPANDLDKKIFIGKVNNHYIFRLDDEQIKIKKENFLNASIDISNIYKNNGENNLLHQINKIFNHNPQLVDAAFLVLHKIKYEKTSFHNNSIKNLAGCVIISHGLGIKKIYDFFLRTIAQQLRLKKYRDAFWINPKCIIENLNFIEENLNKGEITEIKRVLFEDYYDQILPEKKYTHVCRMYSPQKNITQMIFSPQNSYLLSISKELYAICLWDLKTKQLIDRFKDQPHLGTQMAFNSCDTLLALSRINNIHYYNLQEKKILPAITTTSNTIKNIKFHKKNPAKISVGNKKKNIPWNTHDIAMINSNTKMFNYTSAPAFHIDGITYARGTKEGKLEVQQLNKYTSIDQYTISSNSTPVTSASFSPDGTYLAASCTNVHHPNSTIALHRLENNFKNPSLTEQLLVFYALEERKENPDATIILDKNNGIINRLHKHLSPNLKASIPNSLFEIRKK